MKKILITMSLLVSTNLLLAEEASLNLPSSVPIEVFKMKEDQRAIGYIGFNVNLELEDDYYKDKVGIAKFESKGLIYTEPREVETFLGNMFELSYTAGMITSNLKDNTFFDNGKNYNNTFDKKGFYIGIRPAFNNELYSNKWFIVRNSTALNTFLYTLNGDFSVNDGTRSYAYDEKSYGLGMKPSTVLQLTAYPTNHLGITAFGGITTFIAGNYTDYSGGLTNNGNSVENDEDSEVGFYTTGVNPIYGFDITYNFLGKYQLNLSTAITQQDTDNSVETIVRYTYTF